MMTTSIQERIHALRIRRAQEHAYSGEVREYTLEIHEAEEGGHWGEVRELPGCVSQGETLDELRRNVKEAIEAVAQDEHPEQSQTAVHLPVHPAEQTIGLILIDPKTAEHWRLGDSGSRTATAST